MSAEEIYPLIPPDTIEQTLDRHLFGDEELAQFAAEVDALKGQVRARVTLHACDERLDPTGPWVYQPWEPIALPRGLGGGGGTRFSPVFGWIADARVRPDLSLYFTDAEGEFPRHPPE